MESILSITCAVLIFFIGYFFLKDKKIKQDPIFMSKDNFDPAHEMAPGEPAKRAYLSQEEKTTGLVQFIMSRGPGMVTRVVIVWILTISFSGFIGAKYSERFAEVGADIFRLDIPSAVVKLVSLGREPATEYKNIAFGKNNYLSENGLEEFAYIGSKNSTAYAVMETVYSTQHHDPDLSSKDKAYNNPMTDMDVSSAIDLCKERYGDHNGNLMSFDEWEKAQSNFLGKNNFNIPDESEWTRTKYKADDDYYKVINRDHIEKSEIDYKEKGQYIEEDEFGKILLRCSINWPIKE